MHAAASVAVAYDEDGSALLLNTSLRERNPEFVRVTPEVGLLWQRLTEGQALAVALQAVATEYAVPVEQVQQDMAPCIADLTRRRMFTNRWKRSRLAIEDPLGATATNRVTAARSTKRPPRYRYRIAGVAGFVVSLVLLRLLPLRVTLAIMQASLHLRRQTPTLDSAERLVVCARQAARHYPGNADCLEISIAAFFAGVMLGEAPQWLFGATFRPLRRHAWVQHADTAFDHEAQRPDTPYRVMLGVQPRKEEQALATLIQNRRAAHAPAAVSGLDETTCAEPQARPPD